MNCSPPGSSVQGFSRQEYWVGCHSLLQGIFPTQGSNLRLLHWKADSLPLVQPGMFYYTTNNDCWSLIIYLTCFYLLWITICDGKRWFVLITWRVDWTPMPKSVGQDYGWPEGGMATAGWGQCLDEVIQPSRLCPWRDPLTPPPDGSYFFIFEGRVKITNQMTQLLWEPHL